MIPSLNSISPGPLSKYICDCCARTLETWQNGLGFWQNMNIRQEIGGVAYFACSLECSRILFQIHHQYAMRQGKA